eukprot:CAMPEP_0119103696 /NCGR_PEP_ID=MMETSP1180-20130426/2082_1 /TAXON_ID=3052 ORGANISM="Chlamydomonas cf sp, Strain CCMP681" /NCGR_SAMPLE_ID=MMETSP1180 /ASSEMBLY_ACC=CAM_ASM_000741 /LENGTH=242 /DNA_ID=CAMNT_0007088265 /DNA_START=21 /DNA_END=749 /DNA_ORIENTATION=-
MAEEEEAPKVAGVRAGRRAQRAVLTQSERAPDTDFSAIQGEGVAAAGAAWGSEATTKQQADDDDSSAPPEPRRGFMDEASAPQTPSADATSAPPTQEGTAKFTGVSRRKQEQQEQQVEQQSKAKNKYDERATEADIMEIPELEEEGKEDLTRMVASAPKVRSNRVQGMEELDEDQQYRLPPTGDRDIDLSILTAVLCSSEQVHEEDEAWDPDLLFSQVASELHGEMDQGAEPSDSPKEAEAL